MTSKDDDDKQQEAKKKQVSLLERYDALTWIVLIVAVLMAYRGRASFINNNNNNNNKDERKHESTTQVWTITPNSTGLKVDAAIYEQFLGSQMSMLHDPPPIMMPSNNDGCVHLFLEVTPNLPNAVDIMNKEWKNQQQQSKNSNCRIMAMANTDQFTTTMLDLKNLELILCKTRQCVEWIQQKQQEHSKKKIHILYTGFTSRPPPLTLQPQQHDKKKNRFQKFLHVAGQSPHKGTVTILQAWLQHPHWPTLTLTSYQNKLMDTIMPQVLQSHQSLPPNIKHIDRKLPLEELDALMQSHGIHLCLSGMEGFGHYLNEARAVGAMVLATNHAAMNELITTSTTGILLEPTKVLEWTNGLPFGSVEAPELVRVVENIVLPMSIEKREAMGERAREAFATDRQAFQRRMVQFQCYINKCGSAAAELQQQRCAAQECGLTLE